TKLYFGPDFIFMASDNQAEAAERIIARYCREIEESGIDRVQILSPFRSEGAASAEQLNEAIREVVNPFRSAEEEIKIGVKVFQVNDRIMKTKIGSASCRESVKSTVAHIPRDGIMNKQDS